MKRRATLSWLVLALAAPAAAQPAGNPAPGAASGSPATAPLPAPGVSSAVTPEPPNAPPPPAGSETCREQVPEGKQRPVLKQTAPSRATSGHAFTLALVVEHGKGETVLPSGLKLHGDDPGFRALERTGLYVPNPDGGAGPVLVRKEQGERVTTRLELPFVPLPSTPGRNTLVVPALPVSIARASGDVIVLCTQPHTLTVEDPIANASNPMPKANPPPRVQREEWTFLKHALIVAGVALVVGALIAWLVGKWLKRVRPLPPPPAPRPPWEVALEELFDVRHAGLVSEGRLAEHFDRVSDTVRKYLGARFGFDGLESTTRETLSILRGITPRLAPLEAIEGFLRQADLVKFAKTTPSAEDAELVLVGAEHIVQSTMPRAQPLETAPAAEESAPAEPAAAEKPAEIADEAAIWGPKPPREEPGTKPPREEPGTEPPREEPKS